MKKIFYLASIAALAFSSCAKDNATEPSMDDIKGGAKITAAMAADDTRTSLEKVDGKYEFRWSAGDQLGVYGVGGGLNNAAFVLNNNSDGQAVGVFASQSTELKADGNYIAVYPRFQESLFTAADIKAVKWDNPANPTPEVTSDDVAYPNYEAVKVYIPAKQKYQPETFYTQTVPAVSTTFVVGNDNAEVSMQPVVDYLFVNIKSTEAIKTLKLELIDGTTKAAMQIAGQGNLEKYILNGAYRYALKSVNGDKAIVLEMDESSDAVSCHDANTYVFTVPAGILGMNNDVRAKIYVNNDTEAAFHLTSSGKEGTYSNDLLNYFWNTKGTATTADDVKVSRYDASNSKWLSRQENTVFWANPISVDTDGDKVADARGAFRYNPNGDVIIENEVELLEYIHKYNAGDEDFYNHDAFLCEGATFDFSIKNMMELATEYENTPYEAYIAAYLADVEDGGGFPCFGYYYYDENGQPHLEGKLFINNFIGNGAVIENIEQPLLSWSGIFGGYNYTTYKLTDMLPVSTTRSGEYVDTEYGKHSITNVTFSNIVAKSDVVYSDDYVLSDGVIVEYTCRGHVLAGSFKGTIKNVTVKNANGESIMGYMDVAQYKGMDIEGVSKLDNIANHLNANASLDLTETWGVVSGVKESIFSKIHPNESVTDNDSAADLHVITIAEGDGSAYAKLTDNVSVESNDSAVAVLINGVSYWTGDHFEADFQSDSNCVDKNAKGTKYYYVKYAEQLMAGNTQNVNKGAYLTRDMDMNFANLVRYNTNGTINHAASKYWNWHKKGGVSMNILDGAGHTVKGINFYLASTKSSNKGQGIAPFLTLSVLKNITFDGVNMTIVCNSNGVLPEYMGGISMKDMDEISNVTVNNVVINGYRGDTTSNTQANYGSNYSVKLGWIAARGNNVKVNNAVVNGASTNITGISGLVGEVKLYDAAGTDPVTAASKFTSASIANVETPGAAIAKFAKYNADKYHYNDEGTLVGLVVNKASRKADIKFMNSGKPVFYYDAPYTINVIYDEVEKTSLTNN